MESRRASVMSNASLRQRKYSTTRLLRQAELSARLEEARPIVWRTGVFDEHPDERDIKPLELENIRTFTRADSVVSPFAFHPGSRVGTTLRSSTNLHEWTPEKPWDEPTTTQQQDIERRAAISKRVATTPLDLTATEAQISGSLAAKPISYNTVRKWLTWKPNMQRARKPSLANGLHVTTGMHTALGVNLVARNSPDWVKRQQLHALEYITAKFQGFSCNTNVAFGHTEAFKQHLSQIKNMPLSSSNESAVRLLQIRNNVDAFRFIDEAFGISSPEIHYGERGFREWLKGNHSLRETSDLRQAFSMTIRWRPGFDVNRQVICMALGIDLGDSPGCNDLLRSYYGDQSQGEPSTSRKGRVAVYMQRGLVKATPNPRVTQFNSSGHAFADFARQDNLVICEYSSDAWSEISHTPTLLALSPVAGLRLDGTAAVMASVMNEIFWEVVSKWQSQVTAIHQPFADLEERIYAEPSDITHSDELWKWSRNLQNMLKLLVRHLKAIQTFQDDFALFAEIEDGTEWLDDVLIRLKHMADNIRDDYIEPLEHMIDLMYKSVTIRDSRLSLELGTSLWRLSWITFIFLPLTFLVGFFGMNVDTFHDDPSIKWYFVALVPLALIIMVFWVAFNKYGTISQTFRTHNLK